MKCPWPRKSALYVYLVNIRVSNMHQHGENEEHWVQWEHWYDWDQDIEFLKNIENIENNEKTEMVIISFTLTSLTQTQFSTLNGVRCVSGISKQINMNRACHTGVDFMSTHTHTLIHSRTYASLHTPNLPHLALTILQNMQSAPERKVTFATQVTVQEEKRR